MSVLKTISKESIPRALEKAERYRLLNEPFFAESICLDVLLVSPDDHKALTIYVLALTDQFNLGVECEGASRATQAIARMVTEYDRAYYTGIVFERRAAATLHRGSYGANNAAWYDLQDAIHAYEKADALQTDDSNDDAILRYNTCIRLIETHRLRAPSPETGELPLE